MAASSDLHIMADSRPIGIFDSGIGGLTVASAIMKRLPKEDLLYFGDTAHLPYGDKSPELITRYSLGITRFLLSHHVKAIVIACNTASSLGGKAVEAFAGGEIPVINVIDPTVRYVNHSYSGGKVGLIATKATVKSGIYSRKLLELNPNMPVEEVATPLLAPMIEEGFFDNNISKTIINSYLSNRRLKHVKKLILGCTHYPLIFPEIERFYQGKVEIIDSAFQVAEALAGALHDREWLKLDESKGRRTFYVSDFTESFQKSARLFFGNKLQLQQIDLWKDL